MQLVEALCYEPEVTVSIPDEATVFFNVPNPSRSTMALGSTQALTEMSTRNLPGGGGAVVNGGRRVRLTNLLPPASELS
jgi:hypothetical protein